MTNNHKIKYSTVPILSYSWSSGTSTFLNTANFNSNDSFNRNSWNHLIFANDVISTNTNYYCTFRNLIYSNGSTNQPIDTKSVMTPLTNIYFCGSDNSIPQCTGVSWIDAYYKNLRIWDGNWTNMWAVLQLFN